MKNFGILLALLWAWAAGAAVTPTGPNFHTSTGRGGAGLTNRDDWLSTNSYTAYVPDFFLDDTGKQYTTGQNTFPPGGRVTDAVSSGGLYLWYPGSTDDLGLSNWVAGSGWSSIPSNTWFYAGTNGFLLNGTGAQPVTSVIVVGTTNLTTATNYSNLGVGVDPGINNPGLGSPNLAIGLDTSSGFFPLYIGNKQGGNMWLMIQNTNGSASYGLEGTHAKINGPAWVQIAGGPTEVNGLTNLGSFYTVGTYNGDGSGLTNLPGSEAISTNTAALRFTTNWTSLTARKTNSNQRATLMLVVKTVDAAAATPSFLVTIEQNGAGGALTNRFQYTAPTGLVFTTTNSYCIGKLNPNAVVIVTDTSNGAGASSTLLDAILESE